MVAMKNASLNLGLVAALALPMLALAGCAANGSSNSSGASSSTSSDSGGGDGRSPTVIRAPSAEDGTARTFDAATNEFMENGLHQFSRGDPAWEETRARWLTKGEREQRFLVSAMFAALIKAQRAGYSDLVQRARHELVLIGRPSVGFMAGILATGTVDTVYDAIADEDKPIRVDDDVRREAAEVLALIGAPATAATVAAIDRSETKSGRRFALQALGNMGDRGGAAAADGLIRWSRADDWVLRVEAVNGLRTFSDVRTRQSLEASLSDEESLVRQKAAEALYKRGEKASLPALRRAQKKARNAGKLGESRRLEGMVRAIETRP